LEKPAQIKTYKKKAGRRVVIIVDSATGSLAPPRRSSGRKSLNFFKDKLGKLRLSLGTYFLGPKAAANL